MKYKNKILAATAGLMLAPVSLAEPTLEISGLVEVEAMAAEDYVGAKSADFTLATVELAFDSAINNRVSTHVAFLYEEDATDFSLDEGTATLALGKWAAFTAGKMYVPFGRYDTLMVSDPQTLVMGETVETVLMLSGNSKDLYGSAYLFNGDSDEASKIAAGENTRISYGFNVGVIREDLFDVGLSYISNIGDTDTMQALETTAASLGVVDSPVAGGSAHFYFTLGPVTLLGEHLTALGSFTNGDLDGTVTNGEQPSASNVEIGVELGAVTVAAGYQKTREALFIGLPETAASASVSFAVAEGATLTAEYASARDYTVSDGGSGETARSATVQLAVEF